MIAAQHEITVTDIGQGAIAFRDVERGMMGFRSDYSPEEGATSKRFMPNGDPPTVTLWGNEE